MEIPDRDLAQKIICCAYSVRNTLGAAFLEKVYENDLAIELTEVGLDYKQQLVGCREGCAPEIWTLSISCSS